jgi:S1-C subfamily serine protease
MGVLEDIQQAVQRVAEAAGGSVVGIGQRWGVGSGVVIGDSRVLTNAHNVRGETVTVTFAEGQTAESQTAEGRTAEARTAEGRVIGFDIDADLAVVEVDTAGAPVVQWAEGASPSIGGPVFALANPGGRGLRVTVGFVSGVERSFRGPRGRRITGSLEHTAPLLPGSSGGPIVDAEGRLLGINTNRLGEGFYLAIPADEALRGQVDALGRGEAARKPRLGIALAPAHVARRLRRAVGLPETEGLLVRQVEEGSPAASAGLAQGDLIVAAGGRAVGDVDDLFHALDAANGSIELAIMRGTEERQVRVTFAAADDSGTASGS